MTQHALILFAITLAAPTTASAATLHVGSGQNYSTIQDAVDAAYTDDKIVVHEGTYTEQVVIDDSGIEALTIVGAAGDTVTLDAPNHKVSALMARDTDLRLKNLTVEAADHHHAAPRAVRMQTTGEGIDVTLTLCSVTLEDHNITDSMAIRCEPDEDDTIAVVGHDVTISAFDLEGEASCEGYTNGWDWEDSAFCAGW
jgi:pectin methylesterase-like acyl-CoA thioesterase